MAVDLFICAGQSNAGNGNGLSGAVPSHLQTADSGIRIWNGASAFVTYQAGVASDFWSQKLGAGNADWGPEAQFLYRYRQKNPATNVYVVKCAVAGRSLYNISGSGSCWDPAWHGSGGYFDNTTADVNAAKAALAGLDPIVRAVLWMQGETDASNVTAAGEYETLLPTALSAMRSQWGDPNTKILLGRITTVWTYASQVREAQVTTATGDPKTGWIDTDAFPLHDGAHYSADGQVSFGDALWTAYDGRAQLAVSW